MHLLCGVQLQIEVRTRIEELTECQVYMYIKSYAYISVDDLPTYLQYYMHQIAPLHS